MAQRYEGCACKEVHQCNHCLSEAESIRLARKWGVDFYLVMRHKGHCIQDAHGASGAESAVRQLWHVMVKLWRRMGEVKGE